ncbi:hypothetical protein SAMN04487972_103174 [Paracoccus halophilus]|uniref:Lipoprotein n=1 Tax=Paracoccus halophilus TaxID=376733 RepID=A0A099F4H4_9RHOB|nr:hypothetical protein [Paracoccus halophilus]KGJ05101.1 hypothetical protein IT41_06825 [Paracoccus halophilus]SFA44182.1 hypothetical protein SAMN04487972_103174 [Paracoccus halophilus]
MTLSKPLLALAATAVLGLAACEQGSAPAVPEDTPGPVAPESALNGTYNLLESNCGDETSDKRLVIDGNKFLFAGASCTAVSSEQRANQTRVTLACEGEAADGNRIVDLQTRPDGTLRMTDDSLTLTYFQCMRAAASSNVMVDQTM